MSQISAAQYAFPHDPFTFPPSFQSSSDSSPLSPILQASQLAYFDASSPSESSSLALPTSNIHNNEKIDPNFNISSFSGHGNHFAIQQHPTLPYQRLYKQFVQLQNELDLLKRENVILKDNYSTLVNAVPQLLSGSGSNAINNTNPGFFSTVSVSAWPKESDFDSETLKKLFWHKSAWNSHNNALKGTTNPDSDRKKTRGKTRAAEGENVAMLYVVNKDGIPVDGFKATEMRKVARTIWIQFRSAGVFPKGWITDAPLSASDGFKREMQTRFEELRLCENGWKVDQIAIDYYPSWRIGVLRRKEEVIVIDENDDEESNDNTDAEAVEVSHSSRKHKIKSAERKAESKRLKPGVAGASGHTSQKQRPRPRPVEKPKTIDPLADIDIMDSAIPNTISPPSTPPVPEINAPEINTETNTPETNVPEVDTPQTNVPETHAPETNIDTPETNASDNGPEVNTPELNVPETNKTNEPEADGAKTSAPDTSLPDANPSALPTPTASVVPLPDVPATSSSSKIGTRRVTTKTIKANSKTPASEKIIEPGDRLTARNFGIRHFKSLNPNGTEGQFKVYWDGVLRAKDGVEKKRFTKMEKEAKAAALLASA